jgi:chromosome partitioning protein
MAGIICSITNHKGGVGKTSLACNLSAALSIRKQRVLVIDNDPQANATGVLLSRDTVIRNSIYELTDPDSNNDIPIENCIYPAIHQGLYILPNVEETSGLEMEFAKRFPECLMLLRNKIREYARNNFDYTFIDCSPTLSLFVANALHAADVVLVPIDGGSAYSMDGLRKVLDMIDAIQNKGNPNLRFLRLLINRSDRRTSISKVIITDINERFGPDQVFKTIIPINTPFQQAEYRKNTIFSFHPTSKGARAYRELAREFLSIFEKEEN